MTKAAKPSHVIYVPDPDTKAGMQRVGAMWPFQSGKYKMQGFNFRIDDKPAPRQLAYEYFDGLYVFPVGHSVTHLDDYRSLDTEKQYGVYVPDEEDEDNLIPVGYMFKLADETGQGRGFVVTITDDARTKRLAREGMHRLVVLPL